VQLDELYTVLRAVKDQEMSEDEAIERLSRSPAWVWVAMAPESKSATSGKAGGLKKVEPLTADRCCEPLTAVRL
jgi:hypothetical protein